MAAPSKGACGSTNTSTRELRPCASPRSTSTRCAAACRSSNVGCRLPASTCSPRRRRKHRTRIFRFPPSKRYTAVFRGEKSYNGVAILSKTAPDEVIHGFDDGEPVWDTRMIAARFGGLWVLNTYVPQGKEITHPDYQAKKEFLKRAAAFAERFTNEKLLWLGDLNVAPTELDVTNPKNKQDHVCFVKELRDLFAGLCAPFLTDLLRQHHPGEELYSFFDYRVKNALARNIGWRIDHILATPPLAPLCTACWIDTEPRGWEKPSDHTPMLADFEL